MNEEQLIDDGEIFGDSPLHRARWFILRLQKEVEELRSQLTEKDELIADLKSQITFQNTDL